MIYSNLTANPHTFPFITKGTFIHAKFSVPKYMQLGVVGSKLKRLSTWSIWPMVENSGFQVDLRYCEWHVGMIIAIHLTNFLYQCNLITHNMGTNSVRSLMPMEKTDRVTNDSRSINLSSSIVWINRSFRQTTKEDNNIDSTLYITKLIDSNML